MKSCVSIWMLQRNSCVVQKAAEKKKNRCRKEHISEKVITTTTFKILQGPNLGTLTPAGAGTWVRGRASALSYTDREGAVPWEALWSLGLCPWCPIPPSCLGALPPSGPLGLTLIQTAHTQYRQGTDPFLQHSANWNHSSSAAQGTLPEALSERGCIIFYFSFKYLSLPQTWWPLKSRDLSSLMFIWHKVGTQSMFDRGWVDGQVGEDTENEIPEQGDLWGIKDLITLPMHRERAELERAPQATAALWVSQVAAACKSLHESLPRDAKSS